MPANVGISLTLTGSNQQALTAVGEVTNALGGLQQAITDLSQTRPDFSGLTAPFVQLAQSATSLVSSLGALAPHLSGMTSLLNAQARALNAQTRAQQQSGQAAVQAAAAAKLNSQAQQAQAAAAAQAAQAQLAQTRAGTAQAQTNLTNARAAQANAQAQQAQARATQQAGQQMQRAGGQAEDLGRTISRLTGLIQRMVATFAIYKIAQGFKTMIELGFEFNKTMESSSMSLGALVISTHKFTTLTGRLATGMEAWAASVRIGRKEVEMLQKVNLDTAATLPELITGFQQVRAVAGGQRAGSQDFVTLTKRMMLLGQLAQIEPRLMPEEFRSGITGKIREGQTRIAPMLLSQQFEGKKVTKEMIQGWFEAGTAVTNLNKVLLFTEELAKRQGSLWEVTMSNLKDFASRLLGSSFKPLFEYIKSQANTLTEALKAPDSAAKLERQFRGINDALIDMIENLKIWLGLIGKLGENTGGAPARIAGWAAQVLGLTLAWKGLGLIIRLVSGESLAAFGGVHGLIIAGAILAITELIRAWKKLGGIIDGISAKGRNKETDLAVVTGVLAGGGLSPMPGLPFPEPTPAVPPGTKPFIGPPNPFAPRWRPGGQSLWGTPERLIITQNAPTQEDDQETESEKKARRKRDAKALRDARDMERGAAALRARLAGPTLSVPTREGALADLALEEAGIRSNAQKAIDQTRDEEDLSEKTKRAKIQAIRQQEEANLIQARMKTAAEIQQIERELEEFRMEQAQKVTDRQADLYEQERSLAEARIDAEESRTSAWMQQKLKFLEEEATRAKAAADAYEWIGAQKERNEQLQIETERRKQIVELRKQAVDLEEEGPITREQRSINQSEADLRLAQSRFAFSRGQQTRAQLRGALAAEQARLTETLGPGGRALPEEEALQVKQRILDLQAETASLSTNIWLETTAAIGDAFVGAFEDTRNPILAFFEDLGKSIKRILLQTLAEDLVDIIRDATKSKGGSGNLIKDILGGIFGGGTAEGAEGGPASGTAGGTFWEKLKGAFGGIFGGPIQGPPQPGATLPGGAQGPAQPGGGEIPTGTAPGGGLPGWAGGAMAVGGIAGQMIGGRAGRTISGAATGFMLGSMIPIPGAGIVGAAVGGLTGFFGGKDKGKDPIRAQIKNWVTNTWRPAWRELESMGFGRGIFEGAKSSTDIKALGWGKGRPQRFLEDLKESASSLESVMGNAISKAFKRATFEGGWTSFLRSIKDGIGEFMQKGIMEAFIKSSVMTKTLAPIFEELPRLLDDATEKKPIDIASWTETILGSVQGIDWNSIKQLLEPLWGAGRSIELGLRRGAGGGLMTGIPSGFFPVPQVEGGAGASDSRIGGFSRKMPAGGVNIEKVDIRVDRLDSRYDTERLGWDFGAGLEHRVAFNPVG